MTPGPVFLKQHVRKSKYDPIVRKVELLEANPNYAHIRHEDGRESTVSLRDIAPYVEPATVQEPDQPEAVQESEPEPVCADNSGLNTEVSIPPAEDDAHGQTGDTEGCVFSFGEFAPAPIRGFVRRSDRASRTPRRFPEPEEELEAEEELQAEEE